MSEMEIKAALDSLREETGVESVSISTPTVAPRVRIDTAVLAKGVTGAVNMIRTSLGARKSAWSTVIEAVSTSQLMHPDVTESEARTALINVGNELQWYKDAHEETVAALTSSTWRTIQSDILLAKSNKIPLTRTDVITGKEVARGKTSVERDIKAHKAESKRENGSESVTALANLNARISSTMVASNTYVNALKTGAITEWNKVAEAAIDQAEKCTDDQKENLVNRSGLESMTIKTELATVVASVDLLRGELTRLLSDFSSISDSAQLRSKVFSSTWEEKEEGEEKSVPVKTDLDMWGEDGDE